MGPSRERRTRPSYAISSVDNALRLAGILQIEGDITVSAAAARLGVARSTAHRLLSMLVYRDFAVLDEHVYRPGPILTLGKPTGTDFSLIRQASLEPMTALTELTGESTNLTVLTGRTARFIASVEGSQILRVGSREGAAFPAHLVSGGMVLLAELDDEEIDRLYSQTQGDEPPFATTELVALKQNLARIRTAGSWVNVERSERGVVAVSLPVRDGRDQIVAALAVSMPKQRHSADRILQLESALRLATAAITRGLVAAERQS